MCPVLPASGDRILTKNLNKLYKGELINDTIGRRFLESFFINNKITTVNDKENCFYNEIYNELKSIGDTYFVLLRENNCSPHAFLLNFKLVNIFTIRINQFFFNCAI